MSDLCGLIWCALIGLFRPRAALEAENLVLRHQLNMLRRKSQKRLAFSNVDRLVCVADQNACPPPRSLGEYGPVRYSVKNPVSLWPFRPACPRRPPAQSCDAQVKEPAA